MATTVSCDMCKQVCQKAREVSGIFDPRVFNPDWDAGHIRIQMAVQVKATTDVYLTRIGADQSRTLKGLDLCAGCLHKAMNLMLDSLGREHNELEETKFDREATVNCPQCNVPARATFTGNVFNGYVCDICDGDVPG